MFNSFLVIFQLFFGKCNQREDQIFFIKSRIHVQCSIQSNRSTFQNTNNQSNQMKRTGDEMEFPLKKAKLYVETQVGKNLKIYF